MPADEVTRGTDVESSRVRTGPRHAAPRKPLFTRFHVPAGKAIALAAMPTAVLMGMGFTPTLALADGNDAAPPTSNSLTADEYKDCVAALEGAEKDTSESPTPSATDGADDGKDDTKEPSPSATAGDSGKDAGGSSSPDSGSDDEDGENGQDDKAEPAPSSSAPQESQGKESRSGEAAGSAAESSPSASESGGGLLEGIGGALEDIFTGGKKAGESTGSTPAPSASGSADESDPVKETTDKVTGTVKDTVEDVTDAASKAAEDTTDSVDKAAEEAKEDAEKAKDEAEEKAKDKAEDKAEDEATSSPGPSASASAGKDADDCPVATDDQGGVDNKMPLPDDPWQLNASSLTLKGASYKGVVEVRTANGTTKKVLKYVISNGTDIGDLHQTVQDEQAGKTYHVQAAQGSTSTIRDGDTVMYTESISGNLLGLIPITFDPENPPPLDIPLIYFTKVTVVQAGQFGGTLHVPGLHQYTT